MEDQGPLSSPRIGDGTAFALSSSLEARLQLEQGGGFPPQGRLLRLLQGRFRWVDAAGSLEEPARRARKGWRQSKLGQVDPGLPRIAREQARGDPNWSCAFRHQLPAHNYRMQCA